MHNSTEKPNTRMSGKNGRTSKGSSDVQQTDKDSWLFNNLILNWENIERAHYTYLQKIAFKKGLIFTEGLTMLC